MISPRANHRLTPRDERIVDCIYRFDAAWPESLHTFFPQLQSLSGIHKVLSRLVRHDWLKRYRYQARRYYVTLGQRAIAHFGELGLVLSPRHTQPLGPRQHPTALFTLRHCTAGGNYRPRLTPQELAQRWPAIPETDNRRPFYETGDQLVLVDIDLGGDAAYRARKWRRYLNRRREDVHAFGELTDAGDLRICIITATTEQAEAVRAELAEKSLAGQTAVDVCVDTELLHWRALPPRKNPMRSNHA